MIEMRELMEEIFPLTEQNNLLSDTSRYAYESLLTSQYLSYGTKSNEITDTNINTWNDVKKKSPLPSIRHRDRLHRQNSQGVSHSGT